MQPVPQISIDHATRTNGWLPGEAAFIVILAWLGGLLCTGAAAFEILSHPALRVSLHEEGIYGIPVTMGLCGMVLFPLPLLFRHARKTSSVAELLQSISWNCSDRVFISAGAIGLAAGFAHSILKRHVTGRDFATFGSAYITVFIITGVAAALLEEVYFRGILYEAMSDWLGTHWSIVLVTFAFCFIHPKNLIGIVPIAVLLGAIRVYTNSTKACFAAHATYNLSLAVMMMPLHIR
jgi:membrane protease YdiL (CAAX protease family)